MSHTLLLVSFAAALTAADPFVGPLTVGTDPGGDELLRVGGSARWSGGSSPPVPAAVDVLIGGGKIVAGGGVSAATLTATGLVPGRVPYASGGGILVDHGGLVYSPSSLTVGDGTTGAVISGNSSIANSCDLLLKRGGNMRWVMSCSGTESTGDAGGSLLIRARNDAGAAIDDPISILRAAGGAITLARPTFFTNATDATTAANGAVRLSGGMSVAKNVVAGGLLLGQNLWTGATEATFTTPTTGNYSWIKISRGGNTYGDYFGDIVISGTRQSTQLDVIFASYIVHLKWQSASVATPQDSVMIDSIRVMGSSTSSQFTPIVATMNGELYVGITRVSGQTGLTWSTELRGKYRSGMTVSVENNKPAPAWTTYGAPISQFDYLGNATYAGSVIANGTGSSRTTVAGNAVATNGAFGSKRGLRVVSDDQDASSYGINLAGSRILDTRQTSGKRYQRIIDSQVYPAVNTGVVDTGYCISMYSDLMRNSTGSNQVADNGTMSFLSGMNVSVGHYDTNPCSPQTTQVSGMTLIPYARSGSIGTLYGINVSPSIVGPANVGTFYGMNIGASNSTTTSYGLNIGNQVSSGTAYAINTNVGIINIGDTTDASTVSNGSVRLAGGLSVAKRVVIGGGASVLGTITAKEVKVTSTGADYVFEDGYHLMPLPEVEAFVKREKRLPGMMPAREMQADGMPISEVVTIQLAKIEELTLHAIKAEAENRALRERQVELEARLERLERALMPAKQ